MGKPVQPVSSLPVRRYFVRRRGVWCNPPSGTLSWTPGRSLLLFENYVAAAVPIVGILPWPSSSCLVCVSVGIRWGLAQLRRARAFPITSRLAFSLSAIFGSTSLEIALFVLRWMSYNFYWFSPSWHNRSPRANDCWSPSVDGRWCFADYPGRLDQNVGLFSGCW